MPHAVIRRNRPGTMTIACVVALLAAITACSPSGRAGTGAPEPGTVHSYKITVAGDSISIGLGASLRTAMGDAAVVKVIGEEGTGLARPNGFDWPGRLAQLAREFPPRVLVLSLSSNDAVDLVDADGTVVAPVRDADAWDAEYRHRLAASFDAFADTHTTVIWIGHVRTADPAVGATNRHIQQLAAAVAADRAFVEVSDLADLLGTGDGPATRCLMPDGLHLTVSCLDEAATKLRPTLPVT